MLLKASYLFDSFKNGLENNFVVNRLPITHGIKTQFRLFVSNHGTSDDLIEFDKTILTRDNILKNAQNGWVSKAEIEFNQLKSSYDSKSWKTPIAILMETQDWPLLAFIEYQKKQFEAAEIALNKGIEADWLLESKYFFKEMIFHRIHLIHNQAKVLFKKNKRLEAINEILNLIKLMADPEKSFFSPPIKLDLNLLKDEYASILFHHLSDSLVIIGNESPELFQQIINKFDRPVVNENNIYNVALNHILSFSQNKNINNPSLKQILLTGNFLYAGIWYSAVAVLHKFCEENEPKFASSIIQMLTEKVAPNFWIQFVKSKS